jgi:hypothetical protein
MLRVVAAAFFASLLGGDISAAPGSKDPPPKLFYPTKVGTKRVYDRDTGGRYVEVVTEAKTAGGETLVTVCEEADGKLEPSDVVSVTDKALASRYSGADPFNPPVTFLKPAAKAGETWDVDSVANGLTIKGKFTAKGEEEVEVPAGKFKALRVEAEMTVNGRPFRSTAWYALDVGMVKTVNPSNTKVLRTITVGDK